MIRLLFRTIQVSKHRRKSSVLYCTKLQFMTSKSKQKIQQIQKFAYIPRKAKAKKKKKLLEIILLRRLNTE